MVIDSVNPEVAVFHSKMDALGLIQFSIPSSNFSNGDSFPVILEDTARYASLVLAPAEGFGLWPRQKRAFYAVLAHFFGNYCVQ